MAAKITHFQSFDDGSGAEALIECSGFCWSFNVRGAEVVSNAVNSRNCFGNKAIGIRRSAYKACLKAYNDKLDGLGPAWRALNAEMYDT